MSEYFGIQQLVVRFLSEVFGSDRILLGTFALIFLLFSPAFNESVDIICIEDLLNTMELSRLSQDQPTTASQTRRSVPPIEPDRGNRDLQIRDLLVFD